MFLRRYRYACGEAQEQRIRAHPDYETTDARFDSGDLQVRRISRRLL